MIITNYSIKDIDNFEEFLNKLHIGLSYYKRKHPDMTFKITYTENNIELKTMKLNASCN